MGGVGPQHTSGGDTDSQLAFLVRGILRDFFLQLGQLEAADAAEKIDSFAVRSEAFHATPGTCAFQELIRSGEEKFLMVPRRVAR